MPEDNNNPAPNYTFKLISPYPEMLEAAKRSPIILEQLHRIDDRMMELAEDHVRRTLAASN